VGRWRADALRPLLSAGAAAGAAELALGRLGALQDLAAAARAQPVAERLSLRALACGAVPAWAAAWAAREGSRGPLYSIEYGRAWESTTSSK
jgi:hypothetical protein